MQALTSTKTLYRDDGLILHVVPDPRFRDTPFARTFAALQKNDGSILPESLFKEADLEKLISDLRFAMKQNQDNLAVQVLPKR